MNRVKRTPLAGRMPSHVSRPANKKTSMRQRRSNAEIQQLDLQIVEALAADHPQSVRHIFYLMTDPRLPEPVEKSDRGYRHVQDRCVKLRRSGRIQYSWIADMSRRGYHVDTFDSAGDFLRRTASLYRSNLWRDATYKCEVWAESRSIASVLQQDCEELAVSLFPCGGFSSLSFVHEAAEQHNASGDCRPLVVLYVGDYDPAGVLIDKSLESELRRHLDPEIHLYFHRVGLNEDQVSTYDLPTKSRKLTDKRSQHVEYSVEAEAMPAHVLRGLVRLEIEAMLPERALEVARIVEKEEREQLLTFAAILEPRDGATLSPDDDEERQ
jgi:hypothetical protein